METDWIKVQVQKNGRIAIPRSLREYHHIEPGDEIEVKIRKEEKKVD